MQPKFSVINPLNGLSKEVLDHFDRHESDFYPSLSSRDGGMQRYIDTLLSMEPRLILCHVDEKLVGLLGIVFNQPVWKTYIQYVSVDREYHGHALHEMMIAKANEMAAENGDTRVVARTWSRNYPVLRYMILNEFYHFDTVYDDRIVGVHTYLFTRLVVPPVIEKRVSRLVIIGSRGNYSTGNFIKTLTSLPRTTKKEQTLLPFVLISDPSVPDRTESILLNRENDIIHKIDESIGSINPGAVSHILVLSFTLHAVIKKLSIPADIEVINLVSIVKDLIKNIDKKVLLLATKATYGSRIFDGTGMKYPDIGDIEDIQSVINEIKSGTDPCYYRDRMVGYAGAYGCDCIVLGSTDLHSMFGFDRIYHDVQIIDPLFDLALQIQTVRSMAPRKILNGNTPLPQ